MLQPACPTAPWCFDRFAVQISSVQEKQITVEGYNRCDGKEEHTLDPLVFERCVEWGFCWVEWGFLLESTSHHTTQPLVEFGAKPRAVNLCCSMRQQEGPTQPSPGQWLVKWKRQQPTSPKVIWRHETIIQRAKEALVRLSVTSHCRDQTGTDLGHLREEADGQGEGQAEGREAHKALHGENHPGTGPQEGRPGKEKLC